MYDKASQPDSYAKLCMYMVADRAAVTNILGFWKMYQLFQLKYYEVPSE